MKPLLTLTAVLEAGAGIGLLAAPSAFALLLLGSALDSPAGLFVARLAGIALLALAAGCWLARSDTQSRAARGLVSAMVLYNLGAAIILAAAGIRSEPAGAALWPTVILHAALAFWCITRLLARVPE